MDVFLGRLPPEVVAEADRAAKVEGAGHGARPLRQRSQELGIQRQIVPLDLHAAHRDCQGMLPPGVHVHQLVAAGGRQVGLQHVVGQRDRARAVFQAIGKLVVGERHVQAADRHLREPALPVVKQLGVGVDLAVGAVLEPLLVEFLRQHVDQLAIDLQLPDLRFHGERLPRRERLAARRKRSVAWLLRAVRSSTANPWSLHRTTARRSVRGCGRRESSMRPWAIWPATLNCQGVAAAAS